MITRFKQFLQDREWNNYWSTRAGLGGYLRAAQHLHNAIHVKIACKILGKERLPDYLTRADIDAVTTDPGDWRLDPIHSDITADRTSAAVMEWGDFYRQQYKSLQQNSYSKPDDPEFYWSLHQFMWLFALLVVDRKAASPEEVEDYILFWIDRFGDAVEDPSWRSYSISERVCNWLNIYQLLNVYNLSPKIAASMYKQVVHLAKHLEEYRNGNTNNHLINNGRALYIAGSFLRHEGLSRLGRKIIINEVEKQFTKDGFLNEGSSHYHLIVTKNYLEIMHTAVQNNDRKLMTALKPAVNDMLKACRFFLDRLAPEEWKIPHIGDISPDLPPVMFNSLMQFWQYAEAASCTGREKNDSVGFSVPWYVGRSSMADEVAGQEKGWACYPDSGYYCWSGEKLRIWWHSRNSAQARLHAHNDWGSFQVHLCGEPVFIDPGRDTYYSDAAGTYDNRLTLAQNSVLVDQFEQTIFARRNIFDPSYISDGAGVEWSGDKNEAAFSVRIDAYKRLANPVKHTRVFVVRPEGICIDDRVDGTGQHTLVAAFHLHPDIVCEQMDKESFLLTTPKGKKIRFSPATSNLADLYIKQGGDPATPGGYCCTRYGFRKEIISIFAHYQIDAAVNLKHQVLIYK